MTTWGHLGQYLGTTLGWLGDDLGTTLAKLGKDCRHLWTTLALCRHCINNMEYHTFLYNFITFTFQHKLERSQFSALSHSDFRKRLVSHTERRNHFGSPPVWEPMLFFYIFLIRLRGLHCYCFCLSLIWSKFHFGAEECLWSWSWTIVIFGPLQVENTDVQTQQMAFTRSPSLSNNPMNLNNYLICTVFLSFYILKLKLIYGEISSDLYRYHGVTF